MTLQTLPWRLHVAVSAPAHSSINEPLSYLAAHEVPPGTLVRVPLGRREVPGIVCSCEAAAASPAPPWAERPVSEVLAALPPLDAHWRALIAFTARYYHSALGEVALAALPPTLRRMSNAQLEGSMKRLEKRAEKARKEQPSTPDTPPQPSAEQGAALEAIAQQRAGVFLLFGVTGSGKTEVYMRAVQRALEADAAAQALILVPEINLTPQLADRFTHRFEPLLGAGSVAVLHSALTPAQRLAAWLRAHTGAARIVLGTRVAALTPLPQLALIAVDEEHDASYKQQEGARYSARDLAIWRAHHARVPIILGSATPSLESWHASIPPPAGPGRYQLLALPQRASGSRLPAVRRVDMRRAPRGTVIAPPLLAAIRACVRAGQQALLLLNRRGWAAALHCRACGWSSECPHCSAWRAFHKSDRTLRCHHCGLAQPVPRACPECGNLDIGTGTLGTEQLEERIAAALTQVQRPDGSPARVLRIDADSTRGAGQLDAHLAAVHSGEVDVLVGTQMIAKGHDFRRVALVAAINPDAALLSSDFRAPERLLALLMQAAGRAGRADDESAAPAQMWVQTTMPQHPLFAALARHDWAGFAAQQLDERRAAGLPPYMHLALLRADARTQEAAHAFLAAAARAVQDALAASPAAAQLAWSPPVPLPVQRVAGVERAQLLVESRARSALAQALTAAEQQLRALRPKHRSVIRWAIDVDPLGV